MALAAVIVVGGIMLTVLEEFLMGFVMWEKVVIVGIVMDNKLVVFSLVLVLTSFVINAF